MNNPFVLCWGGGDDFYPYDHGLDYPEDYYVTIEHNWYERYNEYELIGQLNQILESEINNVNNITNN